MAQIWPPNAVEDLDNMKMKLLIKYMVSLRCKMIVKAELKKIGLHGQTIDLGAVEVQQSPTKEQFELLKANLLNFGLELLDDKKSVLINRIKTVIIEMIHYSDEIPSTNISVYLAEKLGCDYKYLSNTFSEIKGITIQEYIILHKVEKVKELLFNQESNLAEIAYKLNYSSVAHLSNQFKKITGLSPSYYKNLKKKRSCNLENL